MTKQIDESHKQYVMRCADLYATESGNKVANREALASALEAALKPGEPVTWAEAEAIAIRPSVEEAIEALLADQTLNNATGVVMAVLKAAPPAQTPCHCKDRPAAGCPGEWEPGCDLGNNETHAKAAVPPRLPIEELYAANASGFSHTSILRSVETAVRKQWIKHLGMNDE